MAQQTGRSEAARAKRAAALTSVGAGAGLTAAKLLIGVLTGSLGILAEAAHSGLDLVAALMTLLAVRLSDRPADASHPYGHGKVENLSAFLEAGLLLITAGWVGYEALGRLFGRAVHVDASGWAFLVMGASIVTDVGRSRALRRVGREHHSQALEADALHFSTDIWSSAAVIAGLAAVRVGDWRGWAGPWEQADAIAALGVCVVVAFVGSRLVKETVDALLDRAPEALATQIADAARTVSGVVTCGRPRLRRVGNKLFADLVVQIPRTVTFNGAHATTEAVEMAVQGALPDTELDLVLHMEPVAAPDERADDTIRYLAREAGLRVHDVRVTQVGNSLEADLHVEVDPTLSLAGSHAQAERLEQTARAVVRGLRSLNTHLEVLAPPVERRVEVTAGRAAEVGRVRAVADALVGLDATHEVRLYESLDQPDGADSHLRGSRIQAREHDLVLHVSFPGDLAMPEVHERSEEIERALRAAVPNLAHVLIHAEPRGEG